MFPTTKRVKLIKKKKFAVAVFDLDNKVFLIHVAVFNISSDAYDKVDFLKKAQIAHLKTDEMLIEVFS